MQANATFVSRRAALQQLACGIGGVGLATLLADDGLLAEAPTKSALPQPHHAPRAKSVIFLNMQGGPSQFESFDYKPEMDKFAGKEVEVRGARNAGNLILPSMWKFAQHGQAGHHVCEIFPHMAAVADELCVIKSMFCDDNNHPGGQKQILTGYNRRMMPSFGSWITYGLGSENRDLPGFVYLAEGFNHHAGFLPAVNQGMPIGNKLPNLKRPGGVSADDQRAQLDLLRDLNTAHAAERTQQDDLHARIEAAELAFRMQMTAPEAVDLTQETAETLSLYGITSAKSAAKPKARGLTQTIGEFGAMCLTARRLVERGVRVVTICVGGRRGWDQHNNLKASIAHNAAVVDQPMAALLTDLRRTGLLDSTLVLWGGEFGRTPTMQSAAGDSRAHHTHGYTMWLAGGGVKPGISYGLTDELGRDIVENKVHVHDLHATLLWQLGLDHEKLTYRYGGRDQRLTDVYGNVVTKILL
jgi:hypothetical protein